MDSQQRETDLGRTVFKLREARELTQDQLHRRSGVSRVTISKLETGQIGAPRIGTLRRLAEALDVPVQSLLNPKKALASATQ
ncbi:MAG: helix-turn-helix domain-containing protein [Actinomycetota bacterium]|nr:helix-turn-helix domain-containing protein [Actinomycetota bacterium]